MNFDTVNFNPPHSLNTAVLFLVFNRIEPTKQVFEAIRKAQPPRLYIAADGARNDRQGEEEKVQDVRDFILGSIDWECEVRTLLSESNLGCKAAVSGAINWFFENEEMGIILEDDCLPSQSFFWYCQELLQKYRHSEEIYLISGDGRASQEVSFEASYSFMKYPLIWGWASWRRVWKNYDVRITNWSKDRQSLINNISAHTGTQRFWKHVFDKIYKDDIDTWDYQLSYLVLKKNAKCIVPKLNLISNIGFGADATHTSDVNSRNANREKFELEFPLSHPSSTDTNKFLNIYYDLNEFTTPNLIIRIANKFSRTLTGKNLIQHR